MYPSAKLVVPKELKKVDNGKLPASMLIKVECGGVMWKWAALSFNLMCKEARTAGIKFRNQGDYRPYERQLSMFKDRYSLVDEGRVPQVTRKFEGKKWFLKKGKSPSATPGTSPHGLALAIDLDVKDGKTLSWLCAHAPKYGFYLQGSDPTHPEFEAWHWQYCAGDKLPDIVKKAVVAFAEASKKKS